MYNEEVLLPMWLESWLSVPWINHIYLIDGGSVDKSFEIANLYSATKKVSVMIEPWKNNFARQRNIAIKLAQADYFMMPDIDEIPCGNLEGSIEPYKCSNGNYHIPYLKFYDWKTLWFFNDGNTPRLDNGLWQFGNKYTMNVYKKGTISSFSNALHEGPVWDTEESRCSFGIKSLTEPESMFIIGHYDQAKHFEQAKQNKTSVEFEMGMKRLRYRLISPATYDGKVYNNIWAKVALHKLDKLGDRSMIEELGAAQLKSFKNQHDILQNYDASVLNSHAVKDYVKL